MEQTEIEALMRKWKPGDRCVAAVDIFYTWANVEIPEGTRGTVQRVDRSGVPWVRWDANASWQGHHGAPKFVDFPTGPHSLQPEPKPL